MQRELKGHWSAYFPQRKLTRDEGSILEKNFWEMCFGSVDVLPVYGFLQKYNMMVTNKRNFLTRDDIDDYADFRYDYRDTMIAQLKQDLYNKNFRLQDQSNCDQIDTLQNRTKFWLNVIDVGVQYLIILMIMIITTEWIILFAVQIYLQIREYKRH